MKWLLTKGGIKDASEIEEDTILCTASMSSYSLMIFSIDEKAREQLLKKCNTDQILVYKESNEFSGLLDFFIPHKLKSSTLRHMVNIARSI